MVLDHAGTTKREPPRTATATPARSPAWATAPRAALARPPLERFVYLEVHAKTHQREVYRRYKLSFIFATTHDNDHPSFGPSLH